jgi:protein-S-isoprenylcysteine O-methyltransferase Ste14
MRGIKQRRTLMEIVYIYLIPGLWMVWAIYWLVAATDVKTTARSESASSRAAHLLPLAIAGALLATRRRLPIPFLNAHFIEPTAVTFFIGAIIVAGGLAFAIWARVVLGRNWSGTVTLKQDHELIRSGPYRWVRHPIYTGLLLGFLGTAIALGEWRGLIAVLIALAALWRKLRHEERWLGEIFGVDYAKYRSEVAALIPFVL